MRSFAVPLRYGKLTIASNSLENSQKLDGDKVETRPIKGTIAHSEATIIPFSAQSFSDAEGLQREEGFNDRS
ncbi:MULTISPECIES: hypothetical protein [Bradyrhizobium]|uniref:Uncharacterized protein n=1 Tax=Bradyrhizobium japonicum TaxID=375 RepID=A0A1Y2JV68_BRAJP|nr:MULTISPECIES: hypothetical protein [Bradyrhizobium]MCS3764772.1 anthranilate/para-aminobenzoate synthase component I [Bradyrhizobium centrosematis]MCS3776176.1 anthranilate/para-aminobenzoate synthase component I [Bradyrhizobium centrosematis]OSJ35196.1 hypothetical protein BSZ19_09230 [Bradyrhizobium japonicum]